MKIAFYKSKGHTVREWLIATAIQTITNGPYSHVELIDDRFTDEAWYSSSILDGGVRKKHITPTEGHWDIYDINCTEPSLVFDFIESQIGLGYDWLGLLTCSLGLGSGSSCKWFCSEIVTEALEVGGLLLHDLWGLDRAEHFTPNKLFSVLCEYNIIKQLSI